MTTTMSVAGAPDITAVYNGGATTFLGSSSNVTAEDWVDFTLVPTSTQSGVTAQVISPGAAATYSFALSPLGGAFNFPVKLSATGLPPGAIATFTPDPAAAGTLPVTFTMTIQTATLAANRSSMDFSDTRFGGGSVAIGLLLLPFIRRKGIGIMSLSLSAALLVGLAVIGGLTGCGATSLHETPQAYTINVTGTATGTSGLELSHSALVTLTVE